MDSPGPTANRASVDVREIQRQLNASRQKEKDSQRKNEELSQENASLKSEMASLRIVLEMTQAEVGEHKGYYSKWKATQEELADLKSVHEESLQDSKRREEAAAATAEAYERKIQRLSTGAREDYLRMKKMKAELRSLRRQGEGNGGPAEMAVDKENFVVERESEARAEHVLNQRAKRGFEDAFPGADIDERQSPEGHAKIGRHPLSDNSNHNSPSSRRISKRPNLRHDTGPESPLRRARIDVEPIVPSTSRILAEETQSERQEPETEETVPLDFHDVKGEPEVERKLAINLHDTTTSRPLVSPESETKPLLFAKAKTGIANKDNVEAPRKINLHDKTKSVPLVSPDTETASMIFGSRAPQRNAELRDDDKVRDDLQNRVAENKQDENRKTVNKNPDVSSNRAADQKEQSKMKQEPVTSKNPPSSVKRDAHMSKADRDVKQETPLGSKAASRSTTPATGSTDKRKLLPIPGWKGGRSSRALAKKDSFEDDDGFGYQASVKSATMKQMQAISMTNSKSNASPGPCGLEDSPLQAKKSTRPGKHGAIPAHIATEMKRSRTTGSAARGGDNDLSSRTHGRDSRPEVIHSDPVHEDSRMTPLGDRNRNVQRGMDAGPGKSIDVKKSDRQGESGRIAGRRAEERGFDSDSAVGGSTKRKQAKAEKYEINPDRNHGLNYAYHEVERRKEERKKLAGHGCIECENYYNAVGEMPVVSRAPIWRSPSPESKRREAGTTSRKCPHGRHVEGHDGADDDDQEGCEAPTEEVKQRLKNKISRHREDWTAPSTPPMYWNIGFPSTQDVAVINQEAERQREAKRAEMRREAEKKDGKYRRVMG